MVGPINSFERTSSCQVDRANAERPTAFKRIAPERERERERLTMGCTLGGALDASKFSNPVPWIGLYIASASILCAVAMAADVFLALQKRKLWFPTRWFSLNATTLTLIAIATKLPVDLTTPMPRRQDQLSKLTGTVLICTTIGNLTPSLGDMFASEATANVVALAILVVTIAVNVCIQLGTGVIYAFVPEHTTVVLFMLILLLLLCSSALTVDTTKQLLEQQFLSKHRQCLDAAGEDLTPKGLKQCIKKCWLMAHTSCPQYVLARSPVCTASGAFCLVSALILAEAGVRSLIEQPMSFCAGTCDYKWSTHLVLLSQAVAIGVGTISPVYRWFSAVSFRRGWRWQDGFMVEKYWVQRLVEWKEAPLPFQINGRQRRKLAHKSKNLILDSLVKLQAGTVVLCKLVRLTSLLPVWSLSGALQHFKSNGESHPRSVDVLSDYVLHLEGEKDLVNLITRSGCSDRKLWIQKGKKKRPAHLIQLIEKHSTVSQGFGGATVFHSERVASLEQNEPPNCWALLVVTLTSIAISLPRIEQDSIESLRCGVTEGLRYVKIIEKNLDAKGLMARSREAADIVWLGVDLHHRWLGEDLHRLVLRDKNGWKLVKTLGDIGEECVKEFCRETRIDPLKWPAKVLAASCMYRVSRTILHECGDKNERGLFQWLRTMISDVLGACLTNLPRVIRMRCFCSTIEKRQESVREAAFLLGEAEDILRILGEEGILRLYPERRDYVDDWVGRRKPDELCLSLE